MTKIGIIRCQERALYGNQRCAGWDCFKAIYEKTGYMADYDSIEIIGFDTCGGCPGRSRYHKIIERGQKFKEKGAEIIHFSSCLANACPNKDKFKEVLEKEVGIPIIEKTHWRSGEKPASSPTKPK